VKAPKEAHTDIASVAACNMGTDNQRRFLGQCDLLRVRSALVDVARRIDQKVVPNVGPTLVFLIQALYPFYLLFALVKIGCGKSRCICRVRNW